MKNDIRREMKLKLRAVERPVYLPLLSPVYLPVGIEAGKTPKTPETIFAYLAHGGELDPSRYIAHALELGKTIAVPRVEGPNLIFHQLVSETGPFDTGAFGIREPRKDSPQLFPVSEAPLRFPALLMIPGLAFTAKGARLGRGKGFYDRFLALFLTTFADRRQDIILAGVCHSFQIVDSIPVENHDIFVDCLLTEKGCILCR